MLVRKAFRFPIVPNSLQEHSLACFYGQKRFVYNYFLQARQEHYKEHQETLSYNQCAKELTRLKKTKEYEWLRQAPSQALQQALRDLDKAYQNFFAKRARYPKFKRRKDKQSIRFPQKFRAETIEGQCYLFVPKLGYVRACIYRPIEGKMKNLTITKTKAGEYFASIQVECHVNEPPFVEKTAIGLDLGLLDLVTYSDGTKVHNPRWFRNTEKKIQRLQRELSRKEKGSENWHKARKKLAKAHERLRRQRQDFWHKLSYQLVSQHHLVCVEDLNVAGMLQNRCLAKSIQDASWSSFVGFLEYKAPWYGCFVQRVGRYFASSKSCSNCGAKKLELELKVREWVCCECGVLHDRDENAAQNILMEGQRLFETSEERPAFVKVDSSGQLALF